MRVTFLGTGSAMPLPDRVQTGLLLQGGADDRALLLDCGAGVLHRLSNTEVGYEDVSTVLLTHDHLDHVSDLLPLLKARWLAGDPRLEVVGPTGTKGLVDRLLDVHEYLAERTEVAVRELAPTGVDDPYTVAGFEVAARETRHSTTCLAYRFGDAFTFGADGEAFEGVTGFADGSAVFAHDCSFPDSVDVDNHPTPSQLGAAFSGHDYGRVYLTHLYPHTHGEHAEMLDSVGDHYDGDVRIARDGLSVEAGE